MKLRYKEPDGRREPALDVAVKESARIRAPSERLRFAAAVAAFGMRLRESEHAGAFTWEDIAALAPAARAGRIATATGRSSWSSWAWARRSARRNQLATATRPSR